MSELLQVTGRRARGLPVESRAVALSCVFMATYVAPLAGVTRTDATGTTRTVRLAEAL